MFNNGIQAVNNAIDVFTKVEKKLEQGIELCNKESEEKKVAINKLNQQASEIDITKKRAERVLIKLKDIIG